MTNKILKRILSVAVILISATTISKAQTVDTVLVVNGVCEMCEYKIESAAQLPGVKTADWDVESKILTLQYESSEVTLKEINASVNKTGYDTEYSAASEEAYNSLHKCCRYRDPAVVEDHQK